MRSASSGARHPPGGQSEGGREGHPERRGLNDFEDGGSSGIDHGKVKSVLLQHLSYLRKLLANRGLMRRIYRPNAPNEEGTSF